MPTLNLNSNQLLEMAQDNQVSTQYWAKVMSESKSSRGFFAHRFGHFQKHRFDIEIAVKVAVTVTLGVALCLTAASASTLFFGAALTLGLSSLIFSQFNLSKHEIAIPAEEMIVGEQQFNAVAWDNYRAKWCRDAQNYGLSENQRALHINMRRVGLGLVLTFAAFAAVASGMAFSLTTFSSVLFAGSLFHRNIDDPAPYAEAESEALPALTA
jgi:hypothetical protein